MKKIHNLFKSPKVERALAIEDLVHKCGAAKIKFVLIEEQRRYLSVRFCIDLHDVIDKVMIILSYQSGYQECPLFNSLTLQLRIPAI